MNRTTTYEHDDAEFEGTRSLIVGTAVYQYEVEGRDVFNVELCHVDCDGLHLSREQMIQVAGKASIELAEKVADDAIYTAHAAGDMEAA